MCLYSVSVTFRSADLTALALRGPANMIYWNAKEKNPLHDITASELMDVKSACFFFV
eukprot:m.99982 g.99982  ORF g.99982 m.99982 type:complete len:57 (-) comp12475_c0_seq7:4828-4998(-)